MRLRARETKKARDKLVNYENPRVLIGVVIVSFCWAALCGWLADRRGRNVPLAAILGFLLGPFGLVIVLILGYVMPRRKP